MTEISSTVGDVGEKGDMGEKGEDGVGIKGSPGVPGAPGETGIPITTTFPPETLYEKVIILFGKHCDKNSSCFLRHTRGPWYRQGRQKWRTW